MTNSAATNVFMLHFPVDGIEHFKIAKNNIIPIPYAIIQIRRGLKCLEEKHWEPVKLNNLPLKRVKLLGYNC